MTPDEFELTLAEAARIPDGTRPLLIGKYSPGLAAVEAPRPVTCYMTRHTSAFADSPPPGCRQVIDVGEHCLRHCQVPERIPPTGVTWYCAPCAIREWHWWNVTEAAGAA